MQSECLFEPPALLVLFENCPPLTDFSIQKSRYRHNKDYVAQKVRKSRFPGKRLLLCRYCREIKSKCRNYIKHQLDEDQMADQFDKKYTEPVADSENKKVCKNSLKGSQNKCSQQTFSAPWRFASVKCPFRAYLSPRFAWG